MAGGQEPSRYTLDYQSASRSVREDGLSRRHDEEWVADVFRRLVYVSILAFCFRPASDGQGNPDVPGISADATGRKFQPRCPESRNGRQDGAGGSGLQGPQQLTATPFAGGGSQGPPSENAASRSRAGS